MAGAVLQAILTDQAYPEALYQAIILRIHADQGSGKVNYRRAAFIKAYLIKNKGRNMTVGLNEASTDRAYVLGRLFAALEYVQYQYDSKINTTIRDSYFDSACTRPAVVFRNSERYGPPDLQFAENIARRGTGHTDACIAE